MALKGNQKKLDKNNNNRIDAQDFQILKKEKAKGRGQGLQDEKMKLGKVKPVKAVLGLAAMGLMGAKYLKNKSKKSGMMTGVGGAAAIEKKKKEILGKKMGGPIKKDGTKTVNPFEKRAKKISKIKKIFKGAGRLGIAGAALGAAGAGAAMLGRKIGKKLDEAKKKKMKGDVKGSTAPYKKMGGGMMQRAGYNVGGSVTVKTKLGRNKPTKMY